ncbi:MAG TPA: ABC transporter ATP-binding protein [Patescibacteria group bacterium]|nr:ABC transporter ATP-binding protein [Patescibacteria group bacterium]
MLEIDGLVVERSGRRVLDRLDWRIERGEWIGLVGANGTGKSTLMQASVGLVPGVTGRIRIGGHDLATQTAAARDCCAVAIAPERLPDGLTVRQLLDLVQASRGLPAGAMTASLQLAERLGLSPWLDAFIGACSLGTRQKAGIVAGLSGRAPLWLLDESLNGLDPVSAFAFKQFLGETQRIGDTAIVLATHGIELAERLLTRVCVLRDGRIGADFDRGRLDAIRADPAQSVEALLVAAMHGD